MQIHRGKEWSVGFAPGWGCGHMRQHFALALPFLVRGISFPFVGTPEMRNIWTADTRSFPVATEFVLLYFSVVRINQKLLWRGSEAHPSSTISGLESGRKEARAKVLLVLQVPLQPSHLLARMGT